MWTGRRERFVFCTDLCAWVWKTWNPAVQQKLVLKRETIWNYIVFSFCVSMFWYLRGKAKSGILHGLYVREPWFDVSIERKIYDYIRL